MSIEKIVGALPNQLTRSYIAREIIYFEVSFACNKIRGAINCKKDIPKHAKK
jgi:hypothetical protein